MVYLAQANSRMKDFYDIAMLASTYDYDGTILREAVAKTLNRRATLLVAEPIVFADTFASDKDKQWSAFIRRIRSEDPSFRHELSIIKAFLKPVYQAIIRDTDFLLTWHHEDGTWK